MKLWCRFGLHQFAAIECRETTVVSSHENAKSIQDHKTYSEWRFKCAYCPETFSLPLQCERTYHQILYVNAPLEKVKGALKTDQVFKVQPQEVQVKPTQYKEPKP